MRRGTQLEKSQQQEREGAKARGAVLQPRSGAGWAKKNDARTATDLIEFKRTDNKSSFTVQLSYLLDVEHHAIMEGRNWVLDFELGGRTFSIRSQEDDIERGPENASSPDNPRHMGTTSLVPSSQVPRRSGRGSGKPVLRRVSTERKGSDRQAVLQGSAARVTGTVPRYRSVSQLRSSPRAEQRLRSVGRNLRTGETGHAEEAPS